MLREMFLGLQEGRSLISVWKMEGPMRSKLVGFLLILAGAPAFAQTAAGLTAIPGVVRDHSFLKLLDVLGGSLKPNLT
jgi:hypothetical protein